MSKRKIVVSLISLLIISSSALIYYASGYNPIEAGECFESGGKYEIAFTPSIVIPAERTCIYEYSDGGKKCQSSNECEGSCLLTPDVRIEKGPGMFDRKYKSGYGVCQETNRSNGCTPGTIENPYPLCT